MPTGRADADPAAPLGDTFKSQGSELRGCDQNPRVFGELIAKIKSYDGSPITRCALLLGAYTFVRISELRGAEWSEFDLELAHSGRAHEDGAGGHRASVETGASGVVGAQAAHRSLTPYSSQMSAS